MFDSLKYLENTKIPLIIEQLVKLENQLISIDVTKGWTESDVKDIQIKSLTNQLSLA